METGRQPRRVAQHLVEAAQKRAAVMFAEIEDRQQVQPLGAGAGVSLSAIGEQAATLVRGAADGERATLGDGKRQPQAP